MANQRLVNTNFWKDTYIIDLDPTQKLLFLYFLTNPRTSLAGVYEISLREVAFDTGIDRDMIEKILIKFCVDGKMYYGRGWLVLRNFVKHQRMNPSIQKGIEKAMAELPAWLREIVENFSAFYDQQKLDLPDSPQSGADRGQDENDGQNGMSGHVAANYSQQPAPTEITEVEDSLGADSYQSEPIEAKLKEAKRKEENINKTITAYGVSPAIK